jgi:hypothetical protein
MAVVQISRIQIRRGKSQSGTGFPQLASGELAWAVDSQELYIGNGSVAEGAPAVGNTKIITELDLGVNGNILNLLEYIYKISDTGIQTGPNSNTPITRYIQERLDDQVTLADFIDPQQLGNGTTDVTADIQRAIFQLYLNANITKASDIGAFQATKNRVVLILPPGEYKITSTLYIPSYATLAGAGADKTKILHSGTGPVIQFINDSSTPTVIDTLGNTLGVTQPRNIIMTGMTIKTTSATATAFQMDAVKDSVFDNINIEGGWVGALSNTSRGIWLRAVSDIVTCERNIFRNITISGFSYAVYTKQDILNNQFDNLYITSVKMGFVLGGDITIPDIANGSAVGEQYGPRQTTITNVQFDGVKQYAVLLYYGTGNSITDVQLNNVGNEGTNGHSQATYPQIYIGTPGNSTKNILSDRSFGNEDSGGDLANPGIDNVDVPYFPEVTGVGSYQLFAPKIIPGGIAGGRTNYDTAFRLPIATDIYGVTDGNISYTIDYTFRSNDGFSRRGTLSITAYPDLGTSGIQYTDEYDYAGPEGTTYIEYSTGNYKPISQALQFKVIFLDENCNEYNGTGTPSTIEVQYINQLDSGEITYTYSSIF